jgi:hypothetical protein
MQDVLIAGHEAASQVRLFPHGVRVVALVDRLETRRVRCGPAADLLEPQIGSSSCVFLGSDK